MSESISPHRQVHSRVSYCTFSVRSCAGLQLSWNRSQVLLFTTRIVAGVRDIHTEIQPAIHDVSLSALAGDWCVPYDSSTEVGREFRSLLVDGYQAQLAVVSHALAYAWASWMFFARARARAGEVSSLISSVVSCKSYRVTPRLSSRVLHW